MGAFLDKPLREKTRETGTNNGITFALSSMQGWRQEQEDAHICKSELDTEKFKKWSCYMVFDGHGGHDVANHVSQHFIDHLLNQEYFKNIESSNGTALEVNEMCLGNAICDAFLSFDTSMETIWKENIREEKQQSMRGGCTAVGILITETHLVFINLGDSRAFYVKTDPASDETTQNQELKINFSTKDHKPENPEEKARILAAGGTVEKILGNGPYRVDGELSVSRAFGDFNYKKATRIDQKLAQKDAKVTALPDIQFMERSDRDSFALIACDGVYDVASNSELLKYLEFKFETESSVQKISDELIETCLSAGSKDNMSAIVIKFEDKTPIGLSNEKIVKLAKVKNELEKFMWIDLSSCHKNCKPEVIVYIQKLLKLKKFEMSWIPGAGIHGFSTEIESIIDDYYLQYPVKVITKTGNCVEDPPE